MHQFPGVLLAREAAMFFDLFYDTQDPQRVWEMVIWQACQMNPGGGGVFCDRVRSSEYLHTWVALRWELRIIVRDHRDQGSVRIQTICQKIFGKGSLHSMHGGTSITPFRNAWFTAYGYLGVIQGPYRPSGLLGTLSTQLVCITAATNFDRSICSGTGWMGNPSSQFSSFSKTHSSTAI